MRCILGMPETSTLKNIGNINIFIICSISIVEILEKFPKRRLTQSKMGCIKDFVETKLFSSPKCRAILLPVFCKHIKDHLESNDEVCPTLINIFICLCH